MTISYRVKSANQIVLRDVAPGAQPQTTLTIAAGVVTPTVWSHLIDTEAAAASDDLDTITLTNLRPGDTLELTPVSAARVTTVKHGTGNITTDNGEDIPMDALTKIVRFKVDAAGTGVVASLIGTVFADPMAFKGSIDASTNPNYPAADAGFVYKISVAGKIGGASGPNVEVNDTLICNVDSSAAGDHATVGANWTILQSNIDPSLYALLASPALTGTPLINGQEAKSFFRIIDRDLLTPPAGVEGAHYLMPATGTILGDWATAGLLNNEIAAFSGGAWLRITPAEGYRVDVMDDDLTLRFDGSAWAPPDQKNIFNIDDYGAKGDTIRLTDVSITAATNVLSSASYTFVSGDVGKQTAVSYAIDKGANVADMQLLTSIQSVNAGNAVLAANATKTVSNGEAVFGTSDGAAFMKAVAAFNTANGGELRTTPGKGYWIDQMPTITAKLAQHIDFEGADLYLHGLPWTTQLVQNAAFQGMLRWDGQDYYNNPTVAFQTAATTLTADLNPGDATATVAATTGMRVGDIVVFKSTADKEWEEPLVLTYFKSHFNYVAGIISGTKIALGVPMRALAMPISAGTINVTTIGIDRKVVTVRGGTFWGHRFAGDFGNGAGQHVFGFSRIDTVLVSDQVFHGITGYPWYAIDCVRVRTSGVVNGRQTDKIPYVEDKTSMWGGLNSHRCIDTEVINSKGLRVRHLIDAGETGRAAAINCDAEHCITAPYRAHFHCEHLEIRNCRARDCKAGVTSDAIRTTVDDSDIGSFGFGLLMAKGGYTTFPRQIFESNNTIWVTRDSDTPDFAAEPSSVADDIFYLDGAFDRIWITNSPEISTTGGAATNALMRFISGAGKEYLGVNISGSKIAAKSMNAAAKAIVLPTAWAGKISQNEFECSNLTTIIEWPEPATATSTRAEIVGNTEISESCTATDLVTYTGAATNWNRRHVAHSNYSKDLTKFPKIGDFGAFQPCFARSLANSPTLAFASAEYVLNENVLTLNFNARITDKNLKTGTLSLGPVPYAIYNGKDVEARGVRVKGVDALKTFDYSQEVVAFMRASTTLDFMDLLFVRASDGALIDFDDTFIDNAVDFDIIGTIHIPLDSRVRRIN